MLSIQTACAAGLIAMISGTLAGRAMAKSSFRGKVLLETLFLAPIVLPPTVVGFFLIVIFGRTSPIGQFIEAVFQQPIMFTWWAAVFASAVVAFPLMYQSAKSGFSGNYRALEESARDLGADERRVFWHITLPLAFPALLSGAILSFVRALGEFGATFMFAGNIPGRTQTLPLAIYMAMDAGNMELAWLWVLLTVSLSLAFLAVIQVLHTKWLG